VLIKSPKDFGAAAIYLIVGIGTLVIAHDYPMGTATRMGAAYFPTVLGGLLSLVGVLALLRSFRSQGEPIAPFAWKSLFIITTAVLLFGALARGAGLVPAVVLLVLASAMASISFRWPTALALAAGLTVFCGLVFIKALGVPLPLFGPWFGV
jgi:Tripartite tricarboxylate transporter TctB family